jgi:hypothetical protein
MVVTGTHKRAAVRSPCAVWQLEEWGEKSRRVWQRDQMYDCGAAGNAKQPALVPALTRLAYLNDLGAASPAASCRRTPRRALPTRVAPNSARILPRARLAKTRKPKPSASYQ